jgi:hypothetical protein
MGQYATAIVTVRMVSVFQPISFQFVKTSHATLLRFPSSAPDKTRKSYITITYVTVLTAIVTTFARVGTATRLRANARKT